jgi:acetoin utilization protein AcuB
MSIVVSTHARISVEAETPFQNIRQIVAKGGSGYTAKSSAREKLCGSYLQCQKGMKNQSAVHCLQCPRLVNFRPQANSVLVRCLWTDDDPVEDLMTLESELVTVSPSTRVSEADNTARENAIRHLLVVEAGKLVGVLCRCDLIEEAAHDETVAERANHCPWTIGPDATLGQAARLMRDRQVGMLPVIARRELLGVVTRGDLRRAGVADALLGGEQCASCSSRSGVFAHPTFQNVNICLDCLDDSYERLDYAELGG